MNYTCIFMKLYINICPHPPLDQSSLPFTCPLHCAHPPGTGTALPPCSVSMPWLSIAKTFLTALRSLGDKVAPKSFPFQRGFSCHLCCHTVMIFLALQSKPLIFLSLPPPLCWAVVSDTALCLPKTADHQQWWQQQKYQELILPLLSRAGQTLSW